MEKPFRSKPGEVTKTENPEMRRKPDFKATNAMPPNKTFLLQKIRKNIFSTAERTITLELFEMDHQEDKI